MARRCRSRPTPRRAAARRIVASRFESWHPAPDLRGAVKEHRVCSSITFPHNLLGPMQRFALSGVLAVVLHIASLSAQQVPGWGDELPPAPALPDSIFAIPTIELPVHWPAPPLTQPPSPVRAIYVNAWAFGGRRFYDLVKLAVRVGFAEVQYDYVRFPDEPESRLATAVFHGRRQGETKRQGVLRNLQLLRDRTRKLGVPFTIDVFGLTTSAPTDMGIGQVWEDLVTTADVVLPMVYPSHYFGGYYRIKHPNSEPYQVIRRAMQDALRRSQPL